MDTYVSMLPTANPSNEDLKVAGWDHEKVYLPPLPQYFPGDMIKLKLPMKERKQFLHVLDKLSRCIRSLSIQAKYKENPVSAKLQTLENIELYLLFWKAATGDVFCIDIQRRKGDHVHANRYVHTLLDAARGYFVEDEFMANQSVDAQQLQDIETLISKVVSSTPASVSSEWMAEQSRE
jgi:hypothetical protein